MKKQIPNLITLGNLLCGVMASLLACQGRTAEAVLFIGLGIVCDFLDGLVARLLNATSTLGKELDSLADIVTSGVAPTFILFNILWNHSTSIYIKYIALLIPLFSAYRLAKFNLDTRQSKHFLGLAVPANAVLWAGIGLWGYEYTLLPFSIISTDSIFCSIFSDPGLVLLALVSVFTDILMISEMPMFSLKFHNLKWGENWYRYLYLIGCVALVLLFDVLGIALCILWYILLSGVVQKQIKNE